MSIVQFLRPASRVALAFGLLLAVTPTPTAAAAASSGRIARAAGTPGVPQEPAVIYAEDFENDPAGTPIRLTGYTGAAPLAQTYTAHAGWLKGCNGWVLDDSAASAGYAPGIADCGDSTKFWNQTRDLADVLGKFNGSADSTRNHAVAAFTWTAPAAGSVEFETAKPIPLTASNRFLTFSVNSVAFNCSVSAPRLSFALLNGSAATSLTTKPINPCTDANAKSYATDSGGTAKAVRGYADSPILFTGDAAGIRMTNGNGSNAGNDAAFDDIRLVDVTPQIDKAFSPAAVASGGTTTLTFTITNTSDLLAKPGWSFTDTLPGGMTVAGPVTTSTTCAGGAVTATAGGTSVGLAGDLKAEQASCTLSVAVTAPKGSYRNCAANTSVLVGVNPPDCATVVFTDPSYTISKVSSPPSGTAVKPGEQVTYTVTVVNTGPVPVDATVTDDLSGVLDDASFGDDVVADVGESAYAEPKLSWTGTLGVGGSATITYSITLDDPGSGDGVLTNQVSGSDESNCPTGTEPGCTTTVGPAKLKIVKTSDAATPVKPGDRVTYTLTVTNSGIGAADDVTITDDLSGVLDDAAYAGDGAADAGAVGFESPKLTWTGDVTPGTPVTVTYSVVVNDSGGDRVLKNTVTGPSGSNCAPGSADPSCSTTANIADLVIAKKADPSATPLTRGATVAYTITLTNPGTAAYPDATISDDLSRVLDDATYNGDVTADRGQAAYAQPTVTWSGEVAAGATVRITYSVTVTGSGDHRLANGVIGPSPSNCPPDQFCGPPDLPVAQLLITKSSDGQALGPLPGGTTVTYTVTVTNIGTADYPAAEVGDDLSQVLDDAAYNGDATADAGKIGYEAPTLTWTGDIAAGATVTITYSVTVDDPDTGDRVLVNTVTGPPGSNCATGSADPACRERVPRADVAVTKTVDTTAARPGQKVVYTVAITNSGKAAYPAYAISDDLSGVLDDATYNEDAVADSGEVAYAQPTLSWTGDVPAGATVTLTYSVTVGDPWPVGDDKLVNAVTGPPGSPCDPADPGDECTTVVDAPRLDFGDLPDSYRTTRAAGGAYHRITATLRLGETVTADTDGRPSVQADGDRDDGIVAVRGATAGSDRLSVDVRATNTGESDAVLAGWVDSDGDATFGSGEVQQVTVAAAGGPAIYTLSWPVRLNGGEVLRLRLRLFGDAVTATGDAATATGDATVTTGTVKVPLTAADATSSAAHTAGGATVARMLTSRLARAAEISPIGFGGAGEVEDYVWDIPALPTSPGVSAGPGGPDQLSVTGAPIGLHLELGAAALVFGAFLTLISRRRVGHRRLSD
ncbi:hypothetical protein AB0M47_22735 [Hamadaea sp. NPDC051192]|uniref:DUF7927 domain-containing protein n=1 Tax=Hamadaea sp. NPDC051192 TaxID=3154940 RepID=UPI00343EDA0E